MTYLLLTEVYIFAILCTNDTLIGGEPMSDEPKRRGPKGNRGRFQLVMPIETLIEVRRLADEENRSVSNMLAVLVKEAIRAREEAKSGNWEPELLEAA